MLHIKSSMDLKKTNLKKGVKRKKNGYEDVEQFSLPQTQLVMMEPNVCLVSTKLDLVTIFSNSCDAKMKVYDSFRFGPEKKHSDVFCFFFCGNRLSRLG